MKASDEYSIPACQPCHYEYDFGKNYSREEKQGAWDRGYDEWKEDRKKAA
jgi:hypothetical protein